MKITVGTKEDLIGFMDDWDHTKCDSASYAVALFPNSYEAIDSAIAEVKSVSLPGRKDLFFTITMFIHFSKVSPLIPKLEKVRKVKRGFTGAVHIHKDDLLDIEGELPVDTIKATISIRLSEQVAQLLNRKDMQQTLDG